MAKSDLQLYDLRYSDLTSLQNDSASSRAGEDPLMMEAIRDRVIEALGPSGPGLFSVSGAPDNILQLRRNLLVLSRKLALLHPDHRERILREHDIGTDVPLKNPERKVSSFATTLKYGESIVSSVEMGGDSDFENLGYEIKKLGSWMMELGLQIARLCDGAIGGRELEQSLLDSGTAKGRLIHYHSVIDKFILRSHQGEKQGFGGLRNRRKQSSQHELELNYDVSDMWQNWHYDYGILTVLTAPMFVLTEEFNNEFLCKECPSPKDHSCLQIFDPNVNKVQMVKVDPDGFIIQVGESAAIMSNGKLRATLHSVSRPHNFDNLSREMFVVFLQPAWTKTFSVSKDCCLWDVKSLLEGDECVADDATTKFAREIRRTVPSLSSRFRDGMTFAEFSRVTTNQYFGSIGLQSN